MQRLRKFLLAGAAVVAAAGVAGAVAAEVRHSHVLEITLPDGSREQIRYVGDTPPQVKLQPAGAAFDLFSPVADPLAFEGPFAALDRISAEMDRQAAALFHEIGTLPGPALGAPEGLTQVDLGKLPPGVQGYSVVSTVTGDGVCTRTVEYTTAGKGHAPKVLTRNSGACGAGPRDGAVPTWSAQAAPGGQALVQARSDGRPHVDPAMVHPISAVD